MTPPSDSGQGLPAATDDQFGASQDFSAFIGKPRVYIVASIPRTGSHFISELLRQCGDLGKPFEYLNLGRRQQWLDNTGAQNLAEMLRRLAQRRTSPGGWFGCKAHWRDFADATANHIVAAFLETRCYLHMRRRDKLAQAISYVIAEQTRSWRSFQQPTHEPVYDRHAIDNALTEIAWQEACWRDFFKAHAIEPLMIDYEDLVAQPQHCIDLIREYLGVPEKIVRPAHTLVRQQATARNDAWRTKYLEPQ